MAVIHQATLIPNKLELLQTWLPSRSWFNGSGSVERVASFRLDDPAGQVGVEFILVRMGDATVLQVPLTYRSAPRTGAESSLVGTMEHSVLGSRWVYDGCTDPVAMSALANVILAGGEQAEMTVEIDGSTVILPPDIVVRGSGNQSLARHPIAEVDATDSGSLTKVKSASWEIDVARVIGTPVDRPMILTGDWPGHASAVLAGLHVQK